MNVAKLRPDYVEAHVADLHEVLSEQAATVQSLWEQSGKADVFDRTRWDGELGDRLSIRNNLTAADFGKRVAQELGTGFDPAELAGFIDASARISAHNINGATVALFIAATKNEEPAAAVAGVFSDLLSSRVDQIASSSVTTSSSFGMTDAARQGGARTKTWVVTSSNPRASHAAMDGETVDLHDNFSNGMAWPGDPNGGADEIAGCECTLTFSEGD